MSRSRLLCLWVVLATVLFPAQANAAADILIINADAAQVGLNDPAHAPSAPGNPGTTLGQLRTNVMLEAARVWGQELSSDVSVRVQVSFAPLDCSDGAVLGAAGPSTLFRDFHGAPLEHTWYPSALADSLNGADLAEGDPDIVAQFNGLIDGPECFSHLTWYYGLDHNPPDDKIDLLVVVLHELAHGLGISNFIDEASGRWVSDYPDIYSRHLFDRDLGLSWDAMSEAQRQSSATNTRKVAWTGDAVRQLAPYLIEDGSPTLNVTPPLAGFSGVVDEANFGPSVAEHPVTAPLKESSPIDACTSVADLDGAVALVKRGGCPFAAKARNIEDAGGSAMLVRNTSAASPPGAMLGNVSVSIPSLHITQSDGLALVDALATGSVTVSLGSSDQLLGADAQGQLLLHTPTPLEPGSSVTHWAPFATRKVTSDNAAMNLLMEPNISPALHDLDVTTAHLQDQGWRVRDRCGNALLEAPEQCDDGNTDPGDGCSEDCLQEFCGDGVLVSVEECDEGSANSQTPDACRPDCTLPRCGDGILDSGEVCDDGNSSPGDGCFACQVETCGDGIVNGAETCDDGNQQRGDGCFECQREYCGDGIRNNITEQCDDGNTQAGDGCFECQREYCGDGLVNNETAGHEQCDDGNLIDGDGCTAECTLEPAPVADTPTTPETQPADAPQPTPDAPQPAPRSPNANTTGDATTPTRIPSGSGQSSPAPTGTTATSAGTSPTDSTQTSDGHTDAASSSLADPPHSDAQPTAPMTGTELASETRSPSDVTSPGTANVDDSLAAPSGAASDGQQPDNAQATSATGSSTEAAPDPTTSRSKDATPPDDSSPVALRSSNESDSGGCSVQGSGAQNSGWWSAALPLLLALGLTQRRRRGA